MRVSWIAAIATAAALWVAGGPGNGAPAWRPWDLATYPIGGRAPLARILPDDLQVPPGTSWYSPCGVSAPTVDWRFAGAASKSEALTNRSNPGTYDLTESGTIGWSTAIGLTFSGSQYAQSSYVPTTAGTLIAKFANATGPDDAGVLVGSMGASGDNDRVYLWPRRYGSTTNRILFGLGVTYYSDGDGLASGTVARIGAVGYRNGAYYITGSFGAAPSYGLAVGALNQAGTPNLAYVGDVSSIVAWDAALTPTQRACIEGLMP